MFAKRIGLTIASFAAVGLAGCVSTHGTLASNAERLERSAAPTDQTGSSRRCATRR
jgi:hypothetical protein